MRSALNGHVAVIKLLLDTGKVDADSKDEDGHTPVCWAAKKWHDAVMRMLEQS